MRRMKHLLSLEELASVDMEQILAASATMKSERGRHPRLPLAGQTWALIFNKSSTRTRVSFEVGIRELGGQALFLSAQDIQIGRGELVKDTARVLGRMIHGAIIRTYAQSDVEQFAQYSGVPTVNALTDQEHPCQVLSDIFTFQEKRGRIGGKVVTFIGDGACNVPVSWVWAASKLEFEFRIAAPAAFIFFLVVKIATKEDVPLGVIAMTRNGTWGLDWNSLPVMAHCHLTEGGQPEFDLKRRT